MTIAINTLLDKLQTDMEDNIDPSNSYSSKPVVKRGIYTARDLEGNLPAVCFICYAEGELEYMGDDISSEIFIRIYGFTETDENGKDDIKKLAHDVIFFLYNDDFTYYNKVWIISNIAYLEPTMPNQPIGEFVFDIKLRNDGTYTNLK